METTVIIDFRNYPYLFKKVQEFGVKTIRDDAHAIIAILSERFTEGLHQTVLVSVGNRKVACLKAVRLLQKIDLKDAKEAIDNVIMGIPYILATGSLETCLRVKKEFETIDNDVIVDIKVMNPTEDTRPEVNNEYNGEEDK
jgi:ribosomal protein L7/L12